MQVLLSTMNLKEESQINNFIKRMRITTDYLIINQVKKKEDVNIKNKKVITVEGKGLSRSRNLALENAKDEIILLADDDVVYEKNYNKIIVDAYKKYKKADIICFFVESKNNERKIKKIKNGKIGIFKIMRIVSFQISMRKNSINDIRFDENFGAGTVYNRGEETIFLKECLDKGKKIIFVDKKIAEAKQSTSTWFNGFTKEYFYIQGKIFKRLYPKMYKLIALQFAIRKYKLYRNYIKFIEAFKLMTRNEKRGKQREI